MHTKLLALLFLISLALKSLAQENPSTNHALWEEQQSESPDNNFDPYQWAERHSLFEGYKQDLNFCNQEVLLSRAYLNIFQVNNIQQHIKHTGPILSRTELQSIKGIDSLTAQNLLHDFNLNAKNRKEPIPWRQVLQYGRHQLIIRSSMGLEKRAGYLKSAKEGGFTGSRIDQLIRYKFRYRNNLQAAFILQKDAGEAWAESSKNFGFDYFSGHLALRNYGFIEELIIGDFNAEFGQGLALWSSMSLGRSFSSVDIRRNGRGINPYAGSDENRFYRGVAARLKWSKVQFDIFLSHKKIDSRLSQPLDQESTISESLGGNGLYRTLSEKEKKDRNALSSLGSRIRYRGGKIDLGINYRLEKLQVPLILSDYLYQMKNFSGSSLQNLSLDWNYMYRSLNLFGELALDAQSDLAFSLGLQSILRDNLRFSYHYRNLGINYQSIWNAPFAAKGIAGEKGHYIGIDWQVNRKLNYNGFYDQQEYRWLAYREISPSKGFDLRNNFKYQLTHQQALTLRVSYSQRESAKTIKGALQANKTKVLQLRLQLEDKKSRKLESKTTLQIKTTDPGTINSGKGFMIAQDLRHLLFKKLLKISYRLAFVNSTNYENRLYSYERDLYMSFSIPAYYRKSLRFFIVTDWQIRESLKIQAKYALSYFNEAKSISSGLNEISGPLRSDLRAQIILKF